MAGTIALLPTIQIEWGSSYHAWYYGPTIQTEWGNS